MAEFTVAVLDASGLKETELFGKQDPYVEIRTNQEKRCTSTRQNAGKNAGRGLRCIITYSLERGKEIIS